MIELGTVNIVIVIRSKVVHSDANMVRMEITLVGC